MKEGIRYICEQCGADFDNRLECVIHEKSCKPKATVLTVYLDSAGRVIEAYEKETNAGRYCDPPLNVITLAESDEIDSADGTYFYVHIEGDHSASSSTVKEWRRKLLDELRHHVMQKCLRTCRKINKIKVEIGE